MKTTLHHNAPLNVPAGRLSNNFFGAHSLRRSTSLPLEKKRLSMVRLQPVGGGLTADEMTQLFDGGAAPSYHRPVNAQVRARLRRQQWETAALCLTLCTIVVVFGYFVGA